MWQQSTFISSKNYQCVASGLFHDRAKANVIFLHGWGDHAGRYFSVGEALHEAGYNILIPDLPGHGRSGGPAARVDDFLELEADLGCFLDSLVLSKPIVLCGHSMGGTLAFHYSIKNPLRIESVIFNSAALTINPRIPLIKRLIAKALGAWLPHIKVAQLKTAEMMTSLPSEISAFNNDNLLYHGRIEAATGRTLMNANQWVTKNFHVYPVPFLALQGDNDDLVNPAGPQLLMDKSPVLEKQLQLYKGSRHDLFHDFSAEQVIGDINKWLESRFGKVGA